MLKYTLLLHGLQSTEAGLPGALLRDLLDAVDVGATPRPLCTSLALMELWRPQGAHSGLNAVVGAWPGDETDEEVFALLEEMS